MSLIFAWITLSGFQSTKMLFFCLSHLFRFATYQAFIFWQSISWLHRHAGLSTSVARRVIAHGSSWLGVHFPLEFGWKGITFLVTKSLSWISRGWTFLLEVCFNLFWCSCTRSSCILSSIKLGLLLMGLQNSTGDTASVLYTWGNVGGLPLLKCVMKHDTHVRQR